MPTPATAENPGGAAAGISPWSCGLVGGKVSTPRGARAGHRAAPCGLGPPLRSRRETHRLRSAHEAGASFEGAPRCGPGHPLGRRDSTDGKKPEGPGKEEDRKSVVEG